MVLDVRELEVFAGAPPAPPVPDEETPAPVPLPEVKQAFENDMVDLSGLAVQVRDPELEAPADVPDTVVFGLDLAGLRKFGTRATVSEATTVTPEEVEKARKFLDTYLRDKGLAPTRANIRTAIRFLEQSRAFLATGWAKYTLSDLQNNDPTFWKASKWCVVGSLGRAAEVMPLVFDFNAWALDHDRCVGTL